MKKYKPSYCEKHIEYWPTHEVGVVGASLFCFLVVGFVFIAIEMFFGRVSNQTRTGFIIALPIVITVLVMFYFSIKIALFTKITVTNEGFFITNQKTNKLKKFLWEDIAVVYFYQENWYGTKSYRIFLKREGSLSGSPKCNYSLPINNVDEKNYKNLFQRSC